MESLLLFFMNSIHLSDVSVVLAYIDPGTGSILLQALIATLVGAAVAIKLFWHRILKFLGIRKNTNPEPTEKQE
jgi:hypothetical protein